jgi:hyperosmotically inducible protein
MRMFSTAKLLIALLLIASFASACTTLTGRSTGRYVDDQTITGKVKARLTEHKASNFTRIAVKTNDGVVYLEGVVDSDADRATAETIARGVPEAMRVVNQLQVSAQPSALPR